MRSLREDSGFTLIEVLVAAFILLATATAVTMSIDGASRASANDRFRSVASSLAQQDQERLGALDPAQLSSPPQQPNKTVGGVSYTIQSTATAKSESDPSPDCGGDAYAASYVQLESKVTWPNMRVKPVVMTSIASVPPNTTGGKIVISVQDRNGDPESGTTVNLTGTRTATGTTTAKGCVSFDNVPAGTAHIEVTRSGYVDVDGHPTWTKDVTVVDNRTATVGPVVYDQAGKATVTVRAKIGSTYYTTGITADRLTATQPGMSSARRFGTSGTQAASIQTINGDAGTSPGLFPFTSNYGIWAGDCNTEDPARNGSSANSVAITPGGNAAVTITLPGINPYVQFRATALGVPAWTPLGGADVSITPTSTGCGTTRMILGTVGATGYLANPVALPYGSYTACAHINYPGVGDYKVLKSFTLNSSTQSGINPFSIDFDGTTGTGLLTGTCP